jgi:hypothetical protein
MKVTPILKLVSVEREFKRKIEEENLTRMMYTFLSDSLPLPLPLPLSILSVFLHLVSYKRRSIE